MVRKKETSSLSENFKKQESNLKKRENVTRVKGDYNQEIKANGKKSVISKNEIPSGIKTNADSKTEINLGNKTSTVSKIAKASGSKINQTVSTGAKSVKESLDKSDFEGVRVATEGVNTVAKTTAKTVNVVNKNRALKKEVQQKLMKKELAIKSDSEVTKLKLQKTDQQIEILTEDIKTQKKTISKIKNADKADKIDNKVTNSKLNEKTKILHKSEKKLSLTVQEKEKLEKVLNKKDKELSNLTVKKVKGNTKKKNALKKIASSPIAVTKQGASKFKNELEDSEESDGIKLVNQSSLAVAKATKKLSKGSIKGIKSTAKLSKQNSKMKNLDSKFKKKSNNVTKVDQKQKLKKSLYKKKSMAIQKNANKFIGTNGITRFINFFKDGKLSLKMLKEFIGGKVALLLGGGLGFIVPIFIFGGFTLIIIGGILGASTSPQYEEQVGGGKELSPQVERYRELITTEAEKIEIEEYIDLALAIVQIESNGIGNDIMQSSESAGFPPNYFNNPTDSVKQGLRHMKQIINILKVYNNNYETNMKLIAQSYNYGVAFASYVGNRGGEYTLEMSEDYSRTVVAPSLGNTTGRTYSYVNEISTALGKSYLYVDGGNFMYGDLVNQYIGVIFGDGEYTLPVDNPVISSPFGWRSDPFGGGAEFHRGLDFANPYGTAIKAIQGGKVITSEYHYSWGNHVVILHEDGKISLYAHQSSVNVQVGDMVTTGQVIGAIGSTGNSTGAHLHLEMAKTNNLSQDNLIDPTTVLGIK